MALVSTRELIEIAEKGNFALPAFNVPSLEFILWVLEEAEERKSPVILQLAPVEYRLLDLAAISASVVALSGKFSIPFSLHLDHSHEPQDNMDALLNHFSSVMIDGSRSPLAANIQLTRKVVEMAHLAGALVEGEIGRVGGLEGDSQWETDPESDEFYTSPEEAALFARETGVDLLAVAVGTRHGLYNGMVPHLQFDRIRDIRSSTGLPLVIHGGTGTPVEQLQKASELGVRKINFSTTLRLAFLGGVKEYTALHPEELFFPLIFREISPRVKVAARECMDSSLSMNRV